jgi:hypothetical protein|tara:strand:- start:500 stop:793 length:294 start_codon:yes stop_codon:yes gene_type:complete
MYRGSLALAVSGCVSSIEAIYCLVREVYRHLHPTEQTKLQVQEGEVPLDQLLLLFAMTRHLIASRTSASELAPFEQARKDAALSRRRESARLSQCQN